MKNEIIKFIEEAIEKAEKEQSKLTKEAFEAPGFTSPKIRHLLNNLGEMSEAHYLEVGVHKGATFVATNFKNNLLSSIAVDNWSEFAQDGETKKEFIKNTNNLLLPNTYEFYEKDCFSLTKEEIKNPVNFFLYDGCHSYESQFKALTYFYPFLDDTFLFLVDDWNWPDPQRGTRQAIQDLKLKTLFEKELDQGWWNGLFVSLLKK
jgi:hypothetical protein